MTDSEIHAVMTAGYACIAGSLFAVYISFGVSLNFLKKILFFVNFKFFVT
jgi:nucleoside permease NupC